MGAARIRFMRGPSFTYASVTNNRSTSTSLWRFSALAIAERRTFSMDGEMLLLVARRIWIASPAFCPRIRSITRRAFCGEVLRYRASALASITISLRSRRLRRLLGGSLGRVSLEHPRRRKLAQLVSYHVLGNVHGDELLAVMHGQRMADEIGQNGRAARPGFHHFLLALHVHGLHLLHQVVIHERSLS